MKSLRDIKKLKPAPKKKDPSGDTTETGKPADKITINPEDKNTRPEVYSEAAVVPLKIRVARGRTLRKYHSKLQRAKMIARGKVSNSKSVQVKSKNIARRAMKRRVAGARGWRYQSLSPSDKMAIDKLVSRKTVAIKAIANRLAPKVKSADMKRVASLHSTGKVKSLNSFMGQVK